MTYNYIVSTGDSTISGSVSSILNKNNLSHSSQQYLSTKYSILDKNGNPKVNPFYFDESIITGSNCSLLSLNSQTLLEGGFSTTEGKNRIYYNIEDSGNYTIDIENSKGNIIFDSGLDLTSNDVLFYDKRINSSPFITGKTSTSIGSWNDVVTNLLYSIDAEDPTFDTSEMEQKYFLFFNGQKVVSFDYSTDLDDVTGIAFAIKKEDQVYEINGVADIYGSGFIEHHVDFYLNGMEEDVANLLQTYTGVYMIETGVNCSFTLVNQETENYIL